MNGDMRILLSGVVIACCLVPRIDAQATSSSIFGTVTDSSGAAIADVAVTATQVETNFTRSTLTNNLGQYALPLLPLGTYQIEISASGFKKFVRTGIVLDLSRNARVDPVLELGDVSTTVTVTSDAPVVNTTDAALGRTVENAEIIGLPLVNRDVYTLLNLTPGVDRVETGGELGGRTVITVVNGSASGTGSVNYYLDGGNNMNGLRNTGNVAPNPDAVQEFRVITNSYGAEFGRFAGGVIDVVTKSGTNSFHGSLFEFLRNDKLNAQTWNLGGDKPPLRRNQFGGTLGGPILKDKLFFFGSYSGLRQRQVETDLGILVASELERRGDFSQSGLGQLVDPVTRAPFPNNVIPTQRLDPTIQRIMEDWLPLPNKAGNRLDSVEPRPFDSNDYQIKGDYSLETHQITGSYFRSAGEEVQPLIGNVPYAKRIFTWTQQNFAAGDTWTLSPTLLNQFRLNYVRNFGGRVPDPQKALGDYGSSFRVQGTPSLPHIAVSGYFTLGNAITGPTAGSNYYGLRDLVNLTRGRHSIKFGAEMYLEKVIHDTLLNNYGTFTFDNAASKSGNALANFILGNPTRMNQDAPILKTNNTWYYGFFFQDDIRLHPRFTLNVGLRYDLQLPYTDPQDRALTFAAGRQSTVVPGAPVGLLFPGDEGVGRGVIEADKNNFAPRLGFAWDPAGDGRTSVRAAAGVFYGSIAGNEWNLMADRQPFTVRQTFNDVRSITDPYGNVPGGDPFPYVYSPANPLFLPFAAVSGISLDFRWPYTYQMNFSVQREVVKDLSITGAYVGSLGHKLPFQRDLNYPLSTPGATTGNVNQRRPYLTGTLSNIYLVESIADTAYHGLQLTAERRMSRRFTFKGYYTFSKALDDVDLQQSNVQVNAQNHRRLDLERARTVTDRRHNLVASTVWDADYFRTAPLPVRVLLDHWTVSAIVTMRSGPPINITSGGDTNLDGQGNDRANLVGDPHLDPNRPRAEVVKEWFNRAAFRPPASGQDGTAGRNILDGPGLKNVDLGLFRNFRLREGMDLQFRGEITNLINFVNLNNPNTTYNASATSSFGTIQSARDMRQVQLGLRLAF
jgi:outer membrane receptor protein involved in Fe transport